MDKNIKINYKTVDASVSKIKEINDIILDYLDNIRDSIESAAPYVWNAPEKDMLIKTFIPYLKENAQSIESGINDNLKVIKKALKKYQEANKILEQKVDDIEVL